MANEPKKTPPTTKRPGPKVMRKTGPGAATTKTSKPGKSE
jgi:hypothetical protein